MNPVVFLFLVVEKHKARVEEEEKQKAAEEAKKAAKLSPLESSPKGQAVQAAGLPPSGNSNKRRKKKKKRPETVEPANSSGCTEADVDRFFGDRSSVPGYSPIVHHRERNGDVPVKSGSNTVEQNGNYIHMNGNSPIFRNGKTKQQFHSHDDVLTASTMNECQAPPPDRPGSSDDLDRDIIPSNRSIQSRYSTAERRPNKKLAPRMTKSFSHHGQLSGKYSTLQADEPGVLKKVISSAEIEQMRRSQIFKVLKGMCGCVIVFFFCLV